MNATPSHNNPSSDSNNNTLLQNNYNNSSSSSSHSGAAAASHHVQPNQACAACKYQRRKCNPDCSLAPYFPADAQRQFLNAHRLFGLKNIQKIIRDLDPIRQSEAMRSIIFESNARADDPVGGCHRMVRQLERQLERDRAELAIVLHQLALCRAQTHLFRPPQDNIHQPIHQQQLQQQQQLFNYLYDAEDQNNNTNVDVNNVVEDRNNNTNDDVVDVNNNVGVYDDQNREVEVEMEIPAEIPAMVSLQQGGEEEDDDDKQQQSTSHSHKMETKVESDAMEDVREHDLKGAASLFTLTNCRTSSSA